MSLLFFWQSSRRLGTDGRLWKIGVHWIPALLGRLGTGGRLWKNGIHRIPALLRRLGTGECFWKNGIPQISLVGYHCTFILKRPTKSRWHCMPFFQKSLMVPNLASIPLNPWVPNLKNTAHVPNCRKSMDSIFNRQGAVPNQGSYCLYEGRSRKGS